MIHVLIPTTPERRDRLEKTVLSVLRNQCNVPVNIIIDTNNYEGYVKSVRRMLDKVDGLVMVVTDDTEIWVTGIQKMYNAYTEAFPNNDGLCVYGDGNWDLNNFGLPFAHSSVLKEIINPIYFHNFADKEMCDIMKLRGKYLPVTAPIMTHQHYTRDSKLLDKTYQLGEDTSDADGALYNMRRAKNFNKVTFVGITRDKEYPKEIDTSWFDEVLIKTESPSVYERYLLAAQAKNDIIYVQDDDCVLDYKELWKHYNGQITNGITRQHFTSYQGSGVTLVGWGAFFPKSMLKNIDAYINKYGVDKHLLREADRIFTFLNQPHNSIVMPHIDFKPQKAGRMWNEADHWTSMNEAIAKLHNIN